MKLWQSLLVWVMILIISVTGITKQHGVIINYYYDRSGEDEDVEIITSSTSDKSKRFKTYDTNNTTTTTTTNNNNNNDHDDNVSRMLPKVEVIDNKHMMISISSNITTTTATETAMNATTKNDAKSPSASAWLFETNVGDRYWYKKYNHHNNANFTTIRSSQRQPLVKIWPILPSKSWSKSWCTRQHYWYTEFGKWTNRMIKSGVIEGLMYVKCPKSSSSTCAGITERIAHTVAKRHLMTSSTITTTTTTTTTNTTTVDDKNKNKNPLEIIPVCTSNSSHKFAYYKRFQGRVRTKSRLWSTIRHPSTQILSMYFHFLVGRKNADPNNDFNILTFLHNQKSMQTKYITQTKGSIMCDDGDDDVQSPNDDDDDELLFIKKIPCLVATMNKTIFNKYDFIAVSDRLDESLVVMKNLWDLELGDILMSSSSKVGGTSWEKIPKRYAHHQCRPIPKQVVSTKVRSYMDSGEHEWKNLDYLLYDAVNQSLDATIDYLGRNKIRKDLTEYRRLQQMVHNECQNRTFFPCSSTGTWQQNLSNKNCYKEDQGCGYQCIDDI